MPGAPIYLPQKPNIWRDMLPSLVQMYAKGMMQQHFQGEKEPEAPKNIAGKEKQWLWDKDKKEYIKSDIPVPQQSGTTPNLQKGKREYVDKSGKVMTQDFNFDPKSGMRTKIGDPYQAKPVSSEAAAKIQNQLVGKQQAGLRQINSVLKKAGIKEIDIFSFAGLSAQEQKKYMELQTKPLIDRVGEPYKAQLKQYYKKVDDITVKIMGTLPTVLTKEKAAELLREAGGDPKKARELATKRGFVF